jgi:hypothetical protein
MELVRVAARAILLPLHPFRVQTLVLVGEIVAILTDLAGKYDFFAWHMTSLVLQTAE